MTKNIPTCHPDKRYGAKGLCHNCYNKQNRLNNYVPHPLPTRYAECHPDRKHRAKGLCTECYNRKYHYATYNDAVRVVKVARVSRRRAVIDFLKGGPCMDCGGSFPPECMDFDHRDGATKLFSISSRTAPTSRATIAQEMDKCDLVCANCHRTRTKNRAIGRPRKPKAQAG